MSADTSIASRRSRGNGHGQAGLLGSTAAEHVVVIQFDNPDQAQGLKNSDAFKNFVRNYVAALSRPRKFYTDCPLLPAAEAEEGEA